MPDYFGTRYSFDKGRHTVWRAIVEYLQAEVPLDAHVLELGAGYCDFINQVRAQKRYANDIDTNARAHCAIGVEFLQSSALAVPLPDASIDVIFASNLFEHFADAELVTLIGEVKRLLKRHGKLIVVQPNYYYAYREYWDDYTHKKAFSHVSLPDFLSANGMTLGRVVPRFLPFSFKSRLPRSYFLTKAYLMSPWRPQAKQMLVVAQKGD